MPTPFRARADHPTPATTTPPPGAAASPPLLSRIRLQRNPATRTLAPLLTDGASFGHNAGQRGHHLIWSLFADHPNRRRDFLWTHTGQDSFLTLSARPPVDTHDLFEIDEPKPFTPALKPGQRLRFQLHANPVINRTHPVRRRVVKHDVVTHTLRGYPRAERQMRRNAAIHHSGIEWLIRQGHHNGFAIDADEVEVGNYQRHEVTRTRSAARRGQDEPDRPRYATLDFEGVLRVVDPARLMRAVAQGFGSSRAYGCGLMLLRRT